MVFYYIYINHRNVYIGNTIQMYRYAIFQLSVQVVEVTDRKTWFKLYFAKYHSVGQTFYVICIHMHKYVFTIFRSNNFLSKCD